MIRILSLSALLLGALPLLTPGAAPPAEAPFQIATTVPVQVPQVAEPVSAVSSRQTAPSARLQRKGAADGRWDAALDQTGLIVSMDPGERDAAPGSAGASTGTGTNMVPPALPVQGQKGQQGKPQRDGKSKGNKAKEGQCGKRKDQKPKEGERGAKGKGPRDGKGPKEGRGPKDGRGPKEGDRGAEGKPPRDGKPPKHGKPPKEGKPPKDGKGHCPKDGEEGKPRPPKDDPGGEERNP